MERELYTMRDPCRFGCRTRNGYVIRKNRQDCVYCLDCDRHQYNAPRVETGLPTERVPSDGIAPELRAMVLHRDHSRCRLCGRGADDTWEGQPVILHVDHFIPRHVVAQIGLVARFADHVGNLVTLCETCNLGKKDRAPEIPDLFVAFINWTLARERPA